MAITNLTGYTWVGNRELDLYNHPYTDRDFFQLDFGDGVHLYESFEFEYYLANSFMLKYDDTEVYYDASNRWTNYELNHIISISGGRYEDITNPDLIAWFQANGTLIPSNPKYISKLNIDDGSGPELYHIKDAAAARVEDLTQEAGLRAEGDTNLQSQIDAIEAKSDVVDVVGTYQELEQYDTSELTARDIVKVLTDSTHNDKISYYRWRDDPEIEIWTWVGSEGPYITPSGLATTGVAFTEATSKEELASGESVATLLGKIKKWLHVLDSKTVETDIADLTQTKNVEIIFDCGDSGQ